MANVFVNLPAPAGGNGAGAAVDVSSMGSLKTIVVGGNANATINIEINNATLAINGGWTPVATVQNSGEKTIEVAARWMRMRVSGYNVHVGGAPTADVGATDDGPQFATLIAPVGDGAGAAVDVSALGLFKTVQVAAAFRGMTIIEVSEDGAEWAQPFAFQTPGFQNLVIAAEFMRVRRNGVPLVNPGLPEVFVAAVDIGSGGGGDTGSAQRFQYTVTGLEPDLTELEIPLPAARANAAYLVWATQEEATNQVAMSVDTGSKTINDFILSLSGEAAVGDIFTFQVADPT